LAPVSWIKKGFRSGNSFFLNKTFIMKKRLLLPVILLAAFGSRAQSSREGTLYLTKSLSSESIQQVEANTSGGGIHVTGVNPSEARIEVYISGNDHNNGLSKEEIQKRLGEQYEFSVTATNHNLVANARNKRNFNDWRKGLTISFEIFVPAAVSTHLSTSGGGIALLNLSGTQDFSTSGGGLNVKQVTGHITGHTSGGGIQVSDSRDDIDLETSGGGIQASRCSGKIKLNTSGGSLDLQDLEGSVYAYTSGGGINGGKIKGELVTHTSGGSITLNDLEASLDASTSGGNINVDFTDVEKYVKLRNSGGSINLMMPKNKGFDLKISGDRVRTDALSNFSGSHDETGINGTVNGGGIPVSADAGGGRVNLSFK
jgi:hypothetical protein